MLQYGVLRYATETESPQPPSRHTDYGPESQPKRTKRGTKHKQRRCSHTVWLKTEPRLGTIHSRGRLCNIRNEFDMNKSLKCNVTVPVPLYPLQIIQTVVESQVLKGRAAKRNIRCVKSHDLSPIRTQHAHDHHNTRSKAASHLRGGRRNDAWSLTPCLINIHRRHAGLPPPSKAVAQASTKAKQRLAPTSSTITARDSPPKRQ